MDDAHRVLIVGDPHSPLTRERAQIAQRAGYRMHWYFPAPADYWRAARPVEIDGFAVHHFRYRWIPKLSPLLETLHVARLLRIVRPHLVHVFMAYPRLYNLVLRRAHPLVVTVMGADILPDQEFRGWRRRLLTRTLLAGADRITSKSRFLDSALLDLGDYRDRIVRVTWGVDPELFRPDLDAGPLRRRLGIPSDATVFFSVRGCRAFYRQHVVIEGFRRFLDRRSDRCVLLVNLWHADDGYLGQLRQQVEVAGLTDTVQFVGPIEQSQLPEYYNAAFAMVSIPPSDGMPQALYESMACGCFPILGALPQYRELVTPEADGLLIPVDDPEAVAAALQWVVDHRQKVEASAGPARDKVLRVADARHQARRVLDMYDELIDHPGDSPSVASDTDRA